MNSKLGGLVGKRFSKGAHSTPTSSVVSSVAKLLSGRLVGSFVQTASLLLIARWAGPARYGSLASLVGISFFLVALFDLGLTTFVLRERAIDVENTDVPFALRAQVYLSSSMGLTVFGIAMGFGVGFPTALAFGAGTGFDKLCDARQAVLIADARATYAGCLLAARRVITLLVLVVGHGIGFDPLTMYGIGLLIAAIASWPLHPRASLAGIVRRPRQFRDIIGRSTHYWVAMMSAQLRELDVTVIMHTAGARVAGIYSVGARLTRPFLLMSGVAANVLLPVMARQDKRAAVAATRRIAVAGVVFVLCGMVIWPFLPWLILTILGKSYASALFASRVLLLTMGPAALCAPLGSVLQASGDAKYVAKNGVLFGVLLLVAAALGSLQFGAGGAAIGVGAMLTVKFGMLVSRGLKLDDSRGAERVAGEVFQK